MGGLGGRLLTMGSPTRFLLCNTLSWAARGKVPENGIQVLVRTAKENVTSCRNAWSSCKSLQKHRLQTEGRQRR